MEPVVYPLDQQMAQAHAGNPAARLEVLWRAFESETGEAIALPPAEADRARVQVWLQDMRGTNSPYFHVYRQRLRQLAFLSMTEKASSVVQLPCNAETDESQPHITLPIPVQPWSRQSERKSAAIRAAVTLSYPNQFVSSGSAQGRCA